MKAGNGFGDATHTRAFDMACYDELPPAIRRELRNSPFNFSAPEMLRTWLKIKEQTILPEPLLAVRFADMIQADIQTKLQRLAL